MLCPMFIRRTRTRPASGEVYYSHRLVRSERSGEKVRQRTLLNLGSDFPVERGHWAVLAPASSSCSRASWCRCPVRRCGTPSASPRSCQQRAVRRDRGCRAADGGCRLPGADPPAFGRRRACRAVGHGAARTGGFAGAAGLQCSARWPTVIARMAAPGSERASWRWLCERSALGELLGVDFERMSMMRLYRASDALMSHRAAIIGRRPVRAALHGEPDQHEGAAEPKAERGHSRRSDCRC